MSKILIQFYAIITCDKCCLNFSNIKITFALMYCNYSPLVLRLRGILSEGIDSILSEGIDSILSEGIDSILS
jgi:hypothetical protein